MPQTACVFIPSSQTINQVSLMRRAKDEECGLFQHEAANEIKRQKLSDDVAFLELTELGSKRHPVDWFS